MRPRILVVEDNVDIARLVKFHLSDLPAAVTVANDGVAGLAAFQGGTFDLLVLDLSLPGLSGAELLERVRADGSQVPALVLSGQPLARDSVLHTLAPIDWLGKPFGVADLVARARQVLSAHASNAAPNIAPDEPIARGSLTIDLQARIATIEDRRLELAPKTFDLLVALAREPGRLFTRRELLERVWGASADVGEHVVNEHIAALRQRIEADPHAPLWIRSGLDGGYRFDIGAGA